MVSLKTLADELGLARSTVSRALRDDTRLPEATRERVRTLAAKLGYRGSAAFSRLMSDVRARRPAAFHRSVAWLDFGPDAQAWTRHPFTRELMAGAVGQAASLGLNFTRLHIPAASRRPRVIDRMLLARGVDGVLLTAGDPVYARGAELPFTTERLALVSAGVWVREPDLHLAANDQFDSAATALRALAGLGYKRVGYLTNAYLERLSEGRFLGGYLAACSGLGAPTRIGACETPADTLAWWRAARVDAVLSPVAGFLEQFRTVGLEAPRDLGYAALDCAEDSVAVSGIHQQTRLMAAAAIDLLAGQFTRAERGAPAFAKRVLVQGRWVAGATTRAHPLAR